MDLKDPMAASSEEEQEEPAPEPLLPLPQPEVEPEPELPPPLEPEPEREPEPARVVLPEPVRCFPYDAALFPRRGTDVLANVAGAPA